MIGKITIGNSFSGCIKYYLEDKIKDQNQVQMKNRAEVLMYNKCYGNGKELVQQFNEVRQLNSKLLKPILLITLSLAPGEISARTSSWKCVNNARKKSVFKTIDLLQSFTGIPLTNTYILLLTE